MTFFLRSRRLPLLLGVLVVVATVIALTLGTNHGLASYSGTITPIPRLMPVVAACAVGLSVSSVVAPRAEALAGPRLSRAVNTTVCGLTVAGACLIVAALGAHALLTDSPYPWTVAGIMASSFAGWTGLSVLSASLLGGPHAWVFPGVSLAVVTLFGYDELGAARPWNVTGSVPTPTTVMVSCVLFTVGLLVWNTRRYRGARHVP